MRALTCLCLALCLLAGAPALAKEPTACGLITQAEAAQYLGMAVEPGKARGPNPIGQTFCFFSGKTDKAVRYVQLTLTLPPPKMRKNMPSARIFASGRDMNANARPVEGLGQKAYWGGSGMKLGAGLHVLQGQYYFVVDVAAGDALKDFVAAKRVAKLVLERLK